MEENKWKYYFPIPNDRNIERLNALLCIRLNEAHIDKGSGKGFFHLIQGKLIRLISYLGEMLLSSCTNITFNHRIRFISSVRTVCDQVNFVFEGTHEGTFSKLLIAFNDNNVINCTEYYEGMTNGAHGCVLTVSEIKSKVTEWVGTYGIT